MVSLALYLAVILAQLSNHSTVAQVRWPQVDQSVTPIIPRHAQLGYPSSTLVEKINKPTSVLFTCFSLNAVSTLHQNWKTRKTILTH